jgi:hypothetical protein
MPKNDENETIYCITKDWLQEEAIERLGRRLTEEEVFTAKKCIDMGIGTSIHIIFSAAIQEAVSHQYH